MQMIPSNFRNVLFGCRRYVSNYSKLQARPLPATVLKEEWMMTDPEPITIEPNLFQKNFRKLIASVERELNVGQSEAESFIGSVHFYPSNRYNRWKHWEHAPAVEELLENIDGKLRLLKQNFSVQDILCNSPILFVSLRTISCQLDHLNILSLPNLRINVLLHFETLMLMTPKKLKEIGFLPQEFDVLTSMKDAPEDVQAEIQQRAVDPETMTLIELKSIISQVSEKFSRQSRKQKERLSINQKVERNYIRPKNVSECIAYLVDKLCISTDEVKESIKRHPRWNQCDINNATQVLTCLRKAKLTNEQIINGLYIILYEADIVKNELQKLDDSSLAEWRNHPLLIDRLVYNFNT